jgi:regulatory protein
MRLTEQSIENAALHHCERFPTSSGHLRRLLMQRARRAEGFADTERALVEERITRVIARLETRGILDDEAYARARAASLSRKGYGTRAIAQKLREKALATEHIEVALRTLSSETAAFQTASDGEEASDPDVHAAFAYAKRRRIGPYRAGDPCPHRQRDMAALARRGFAFSVVIRVLDMRLDEVPELP